MRINWYSFSDHLRDNLVLQINNCYCITMIQILLLDMAMVFTGTHMKIVINVNHKWEPKKSAFISPFLGHFQICPMRFMGIGGGCQSFMEYARSQLAFIFCLMWSFKMNLRQKLNILDIISAKTKFGGNDLNIGILHWHCCY